jgi:hypothetical protein
MGIWKDETDYLNVVYNLKERWIKVNDFDKNK